MLKNPLLNHAALLGLNNPLYAVQLAQLQAAQLLSQTQHLANKSSKSPSTTEMETEADILNSLRKRKYDDDVDSGLGLNLVTKRSPAASPVGIGRDSPLDLSGAAKPGMGLPAPPKVPRIGGGVDEAKFPPGMATWAGALPFLHPFLGGHPDTAAAAAAMTSRFPTLPSPPSSSATATPMLPKNPLEQMSEIAKTGGASVNSKNSAGGQRHSAWQSQWINRGPQNTKDIFKCVWCKDSFPTLQALTTHMKETKHFGSSIPPAAATSPSSSSSSTGRHPSATSPGMKAPPQLTPPSPAAQAPPPPPVTSSNSAKPRDILKEQLPMPRKLVRGQDVWLGRGEQQTKDILKCMWCGESFRSLDLMTKHMQETKHYTKVISQEQLVSWKSADSQGGAGAAGGSGNHVNSVLTCKVCEQSFSSLKELSDHMVKNNHYKDHIKAPAAGGGSESRGGSGNVSSAPSTSSSSAGSGPSASATPLGNGRPSSSGPSSAAKEKRKKSLPVRKLLELERAQQELAGQFKPASVVVPGDASPSMAAAAAALASSAAATGRISCEKCGEKIPMHMFVDHIRQCVGPLPIRPTERTSSPPDDRSGKDGSAKKEEPKSILGSLEKMVQANFGAKKKPGPEGNMSILQRLGIDEGVDYSKPLVDPMAMFRPPVSSSATSPNSAVAAAAAAAAAAFGLFQPHAAAAAAAAQQLAATTTGAGSSKTRSSSECSSPDRIRQEASVKSVESGAKSPASAVSDKSQTAEKAKDEVAAVTNPPSVKSEEDQPEVKDQSTVHSRNSSRSCSTSPRVTSAAASPKDRVSPSVKSDKESANGDANANDDEEEEDESENKKGKKKKSHPLAALQMLCDKTEKTPKSGGSSGSAAPNSLSSASGTDPGAILAFSWACNQAVVNDSLLKCPFCDTPFISKGAYRHHLSKMHFVKDGSSPVMNVNKTTPEKTSPTPGGSGNGGGGTSSEGKEENAQSKFQKYSQLAKQLSCSSQP